MNIANGALYYRGGGSLYIPPGPLNPGWGEAASVHVVGDDLKPLPERLHVTFYSALEDKFYEGNFQLPYDEISQLFAKGYLSPQGAGRAGAKREYVTYRKITVGVAPGGAVAVWLVAQARHTEVFFGYARAVELDWHAALDISRTYSREQSRTDDLKELLTEGGPRAQAMIDHVPLGLWERYRKRYAWRPVFENLPMPTELFPIKFYNGEVDFILLPQAEKDLHSLRATPSQLDYRTPIANSNRMRWDTVFFDEQEVLSAFEHIGGNGEPFELVVRGDDAGGWDKVSVRRGTTVIPLSKIRME